MKEFFSSMSSGDRVVAWSLFWLFACISSIAWAIAVTHIVSYMYHQ